MAKISGLPVSAPLSGAESVPIVQGGATKRATMAEVAAAARAPIAAELEAGASAYGAWLQLPGNAGKTVEEFLATLRSTVPGPANNTYSSRALLAASSKLALSAWLTEFGREGFFAWTDENQSDGTIELRNRVNSAVTLVARDEFEVQKTGGVNGAYDAFAMSDEAIEGDYALWIRREGNAFDAYAGMAVDPTLNTFSMDFGIGFGAGTIYARRSGADVGQYPLKDNSVPGSDGGANWLGLIRTNGVTRIYHNASAPTVQGAVIRHTFDGGAENHQPLRFKAAMYTLGLKCRVRLFAPEAAGTGAGAFDRDGTQIITQPGDGRGRGGAWRRISKTIYHIGEFGGLPGQDITLALQRAAAWLRHKNGGTLVFDGATYFVGQQSFTNSAQWRYKPADLLRLSGFSGKVTIRGNGATWKTNPGLRFGSFAANGAPVPGASNFNSADRATPYLGMIHADVTFTGDLEIEGLTLDGNIGAQVIGGAWGDTGIQFPCDGILIEDATGRVTLRDVTSNFHGRDSFCISRRTILTKSQVGQSLVMLACNGAGSGRQILTCVGGRLAWVMNCSFERAGRNSAGVRSNPASNIDLEPEAGAYGDEWWFVNCISTDADSNGLIMASGRSMRVFWMGGRLVGTTGHAFWVEKPGLRLMHCLVVGCSMDLGAAQIDSAVEEGWATEYDDVEFTDKTAYAPNGIVFGNDAAFPRDIVNFGATYPKSRFRNCKFNLVGSVRLPSSNVNAVYEQPDMKVAAANSQINGMVYGPAWLTGAAPLLIGDRIRGEFYRRNTSAEAFVTQFAGNKAHDFGALAAGAYASTLVNVPSARVGDHRLYFCEGLPSDIEQIGIGRAVADDSVRISVVAPAGAVASARQLVVTGR